MWPLVQTRIQAWPAFTRGLRDLVLLQRFSRTQDPARGKWCGHEAPCDQFGSISNTHTLAHPIRYDFFYTNGVPKWRGTGYYYSRFRPGIGVCARLCLTIFLTLIASILPIPNRWKIYRVEQQTVSTFLVLLTTGLQYMVQRLNHARDLERIERIRQDAKTTAWGDRLVHPESQKKVSVI